MVSALRSFSVVGCIEARAHTMTWIRQAHHARYERLPTHPDTATWIRQAHHARYYKGYLSVHPELVEGWN